MRWAKKFRKICTCTCNSDRYLENINLMYLIFYYKISKCKIKRKLRDCFLKNYMQSKISHFKSKKPALWEQEAFLNTFEQQNIKFSSKYPQKVLLCSFRWLALISNYPLKSVAHESNRSPRRRPSGSCPAVYFRLVIMWAGSKAVRCDVREDSCDARTVGVTNITWCWCRNLVFITTRHHRIALVSVRTSRVTPALLPTQTI